MTVTTQHGGDDDVRRSVLPGGLRIVTESLPAVRSAAVGIWASVGSRDEDLDHAGATHYLEHLLFKGTSKRTALEISAAMDAVGGELNAFTGKEYTCYYARVLDADLPLAIDEPADTVHEVFAAQLYGDTPLGRPILGTVASINEITRGQIADHYSARYTPPDLVVAVAGNVDHDQVARQVREAFGAALTGDGAPTPPRLASTDDSLAAGTGVRLVPRTIEQANLVLGCAGMSRTDEDRFALGVLNAALGGGMSSRLFQEVREKRGLAYSVYSFASQHSDTGMWATYIGCLPAKADEVLAICQEEIAKVISGGLTEAELDRGKGQLRGSLVLGLEDPSSRMSRLGKSELVYPRLEPVDEILASIEAVTHDEVRQVAAKILGRPKVLAVVGPFDDDAPFAAALG